MPPSRVPGRAVAEAPSVHLDQPGLSPGTLSRERQGVPARLTRFGEHPKVGPGSVPYSLFSPDGCSPTRGFPPGLAVQELLGKEPEGKLPGWWRW